MAAAFLNLYRGLLKKRELLKKINRKTLTQQRNSRVCLCLCRGVRDRGGGEHVVAFYSTVPAAHDHNNAF